MIHEHVLILKEYWIWSERFEHETGEYLGDLDISIFPMFRIVLWTNTHSNMTRIVLRHLPSLKIGVFIFRKYYHIHFLCCFNDNLLSIQTIWQSHSSCMWFALLRFLGNVKLRISFVPLFPNGIHYILFCQVSISTDNENIWDWISVDWCQ